eukprot:5258351-Pyramimonas_sp.AAC.1
MWERVRPLSRTVLSEVTVERIADFAGVPVQLPTQSSLRGTPMALRMEAALATLYYPPRQQHSSVSWSALSPCFTRIRITVWRHRAWIRA